MGLDSNNEVLSQALEVSDSEGNEIWQWAEAEGAANQGGRERA